MPLQSLTQRGEFYKLKAAFCIDAGLLRLGSTVLSSKFNGSSDVLNY